jgi:glycosyltransferase involved in cell wall biosynthesis
MGIPESAFVVGHLGRLAPEKNLEFLTRAVADFVASRPDALFLVVGTGPSEQAIRSSFASAGIGARLHNAGILEQQQLTDALHAMDVFAFASRSETQGMVLTEAMAAGLPVVALDAPGAREVVRDKINGRLLYEETTADFSAALHWLADLPADEIRALRQAALATAADFSMERSADKALACYTAIESKSSTGADEDETGWENILAWISTEWDILKSVAGAGDAAIGASLSQDKDD